MVSASALFGLLAKVFDPFVKLFMKRYNQPKLYMKVVYHGDAITSNEKVKMNPKNGLMVYKAYTVTVRNNSEHTAYRLLIRPPKDIHYLGVNPMWDYHTPFLVHGEFEFRLELRVPVYGDKADAEAILKKLRPKSFRIEYENVEGRDFYTEYVWGNPMQTQNQFGSFKTTVKK